MWEANFLKLCRCILFLFLLCMLTTTFAEEPSPEPCNHDWQQVLPGLDPDTGTAYLDPIDEYYHAIGVHYPAHQCSICGATEGFSGGNGSLAPHSFTILSFGFNIQTQTLTFTLTCQICSGEFTFSSTLENIQAASSDDCLLGGKCSSNVKCYINEDGIIVPVDGSEGSLFFTAVVANSEQDFFVLASREYCARCGRPSITRLATASDSLPANWAASEVLSAAEFLSEGMPTALPYQLIDFVTSPDFAIFLK